MSYRSKASSPSGPIPWQRVESAWDLPRSTGSAPRASVPFSTSVGRPFWTYSGSQGQGPRCTQGGTDARSSTNNHSCVFADEFLDFTPNHPRGPVQVPRSEGLAFSMKDTLSSVGKQGSNGLILPFHDCSSCEQEAESDLRLPPIQPLAPSDKEAQHNMTTNRYQSHSSHTPNRHHSSKQRLGSYARAGTEIIFAVPCTVILVW